jgi:kumamolisin
MKKQSKRRERSSSMTNHSNYVPFSPSNKRSLPRGIVTNEPPPGDFVVRVMLKPQNEMKDVEAAARVHPKERKFLTHEEHAKIYGADPAHIKMVEGFAAKNGLKVVSSNAAQRTVLLSGSPAMFSEAFRVQLVTCVIKGKRHRCRIGTVNLPAELVPVVRGVFGLDDRAFAKPHFRVTQRAIPPKPAPAPGGAAAAAAASAGNPGASATAGVAVAHAAPFPTGFTPPQVAALYDYPRQADGTGQVIAILELGGGYRTAELDIYFGQLGIKTPSVTTFAYENGGTNSPGTNALDPSNPDVEVLLDIEVVGSVAPGAKIVMYFGPDASDSSFLGAMSAIIYDTANNPSVVSISWGGSEDSATQQFKTEFDTLLQSASQLGITICAASGDDGSADFASDDPNWDGNTHVDFPASDPFALACGGTQLNAANGQISSEVVWNEGTNDGSGGGVSRFFPLPTYQQNAKVPSAVDPAGTVMRGVPDVAGNAAEETGYRILCDGQQFPDPAQGIPPVGGTSAVAPLWASLIACINQSLGTRSGLINPLLYSIPANAAALHDITQGNNGAYQAGPGWNPCTGLGSPDGQKLLLALQPPANPPAGGNAAGQPTAPTAGATPAPGSTPAPGNTGCH